MGCHEDWIFRRISIFNTPCSFDRAQRHFIRINRIADFRAQQLPFVTRTSWRSRRETPSQIFTLPYPQYHSNCVRVNVPKDLQRGNLTLTAKRGRSGGPPASRYTNVRPYKNLKIKQALSKSCRQAWQCFLSCHTILQTKLIPAWNSGCHNFLF
jgi:hypothetical protein